MKLDYHIWGTISSVLFIFAAYGLYTQLQKIYTRKKLEREGQLAGERPCSVISINRTFASFAAFFGNFLLGMSLPHFDWYLVGTRFVALLLLLLTLREIHNERKDFWSSLCYFTGIALVGIAVTSIFLVRSFLPVLLPVAKIWIVLALFFLLQGYIHQIIILKRSKLVGGVSKRMYEMLLIKELSTIAFAFMIGLQDAWPLLLQHASLLVVEIIILVEIFRIKSNPVKSHQNK